MTMAIFVAILALFNAMALWQRHIFLYVLAAVPNIVFGLYYAWQTDPFTHTSAQYSPTWILGVAIAVLGFFYIVRAIMKAFGR